MIYLSVVDESSRSAFSTITSGSEMDDEAIFDIFFVKDTGFYLKKSFIVLLSLEV